MDKSEYYFVDRLNLTQARWSSVALQGRIVVAPQTNPDLETNTWRKHDHYDNGFFNGTYI